MASEWQYTHKQRCIAGLTKQGPILFTLLFTVSGAAIMGMRVRISSEYFNLPWKKELWYWQLHNFLFFALLNFCYSHWADLSLPMECDDEPGFLRGLPNYAEYHLWQVIKTQKFTEVQCHTNIHSCHFVISSVPSIPVEGLLFALKSEEPENLLQGLLEYV